MDQILQTTETLIRENQVWAGAIVGLIVFGESLVLVGLAIPATALMLLIGGLVGSGVVQPVPILLGATAGAVLGDIVSYILGRWLGPGVVKKWPLNRYRPGVIKAKVFFRKYGFAAVFFGRFFGPLRSTVPLVAGMMAMDNKRFQLANVGSAIVWAPIMLAPGFLAARGAAQIGGISETGWLGMSVGLTIAIFALGGLVGWYLKRTS